MNRTAHPFTLASGLLAACFSGSAVSQVRDDPMPPAPIMLERPGVADFQEPSIEPGREVVAVELAWRKREPREAARRLQGAIRSLLGEEAAGELVSQTSYEALAPAVSGEAAGTWVRLTGMPILVRYDAPYDELRVLNEELDLVEEHGRDVGIEGAREVAEHMLKRFAEAAVIDSRLYRQAAIQVGYKVVGEGALDQDVKPGRIVGYRVTYRPRIAGFQLANAGLRLGVTASGEVASLRVGGVTPQGEWRGDELETTGAGGVRKVQVGVQELTERFYRQVPKGASPQIAWSRVMYVMPENAASAVVEPMLLISATHVLQTADGTLASRRKTLGYSLTDSKASPVDFDAPAARHEETKQIRKE